MERDNLPRPMLRRLWPSRDPTLDGSATTSKLCAGDCNTPAPDVAGMRPNCACADGPPMAGGGRAAAKALRSDASWFTPAMDPATLAALSGCRGSRIMRRKRRDNSSV